MNLKMLSDKIFWFLVRHTRDEAKNRLLRKVCAHIGEGTKLNSKEFGIEPYLIWVGDHVVTAIGTSFAEHDVSWYTVHRYLKKEPVRAGVKMGGIILRDNCFVGAYTVLLGGTDIGENSIIAAGSVVGRKIPPNQVWGGVPARFIMTVDEYAQKVVAAQEELPWIKSGDYRKFSDKDLIRATQMYYLREAPDLN